MKKRLIFIGIIGLIGLIIFSCADRREPLAVSAHPEEWMDRNSPAFHAQAVFESGLAGCQSCHGVDFKGGNAGVSCYKCHSLFPHPEGFTDLNAGSNFHGRFIAEQMNWNILVCQDCHGADYAGEGVGEKNCLRCHTQPNGPEACNTCHGSNENIAPPQDLSNNLSTTSPGVGAHQPHLKNTTWTTAYARECNLCHVMPSTYESPGHVLDDDTPGEAEVVFSSVATGNGKSNPVWDAQNLNCSSVYCHGAFTFQKDSSNFQFAYADSVIQGNYPVLKWNQVGTGQAICGTCHGLPPRGHVENTNCSACHGRVVDADYNIINKNLHINGQIEVF